MSTILALLIATEWNAANLQSCGIDLATLIEGNIRVKLFEFSRTIPW
jgi:hypothetical protein